ncbi:hypothetical protein BDV38DRAFT_247427 [Aspergillus pseudotamarii]|uniref:Uncharacterized protein n=1 Tax=Aspergillus pseudotamarii TaxID=132259 RepID=A0A5N6STW5_ASPPS|nr:uncharacterized protein BDV38DRAFT_247427 [Aspergillus pseudotamarii]KAE8137190.1 hypothetical protein BDV38DRAFT_247427 [Aspergillus pseudotamarii]
MGISYSWLETSFYFFPPFFPFPFLPHLFFFLFLLFPLTITVVVSKSNYISTLYVYS